jgi:hypothetical protein
VDQPGGEDTCSEGYVSKMEDVPAPTMDTRATIGILASMANMKGVILVDRTRDVIEKSLRPRTVLRKGPS